MQPRQMENTEVQKPKYENGSTETEVRKWEEKLPIGFWCLTDLWMCI